MPRIVFAGTPEFACPALAALIEHPDFEVVAVYTQPDRPAGRNRKLVASPIKQLAQQHHLPVEQPLNFKSDADVQQLASYHADWLIVAAYGLLLPQQVLDLPKFCCLNIHASLLPRWRGAAPIQRALMAGDDETGITIMAMALGLDTGDMLTHLPLKIAAHDTSATLLSKLATLGAQGIVGTLEQFANQWANKQTQNDALACYAHKITKQEGQINWHLPAEQILRHIRALTPWPSSYGTLAGQTIKIHQAAMAPSFNRHALPGTITYCGEQGLAVATGATASGAQFDLLITGCQLPNKPKSTPKAIACGHPELFGIGQVWEHPL